MWRAASRGRMVCNRVLPLRKGKGKAARAEPDGNLRLGAPSRHDRCVRSAASILSVRAVGAEMRPMCRGGSGRNNVKG